MSTVTARYSLSLSFRGGGSPGRKSQSKVGAGTEVSKGLSPSVPSYDPPKPETSGGSGKSRKGMSGSAGRLASWARKRFSMSLSNPIHRSSIVPQEDGSMQCGPFVIDSPPTSPTEAPRELGLEKEVEREEEGKEMEAADQSLQESLLSPFSIHLQSTMVDPPLSSVSPDTCSSSSEEDQVASPCPPEKVFPNYKKPEVNEEEEDDEEKEEKEEEGEEEEEEKGVIPTPTILIVKAANDEDDDSDEDEEWDEETRQRMITSRDFPFKPDAPNLEFSLSLDTTRSSDDSFPQDDHQFSSKAPLSTPAPSSSRGSTTRPSSFSFGLRPVRQASLLRRILSKDFCDEDENESANHTLDEESVQEEKKTRRRNSLYFSSRLRSGTTNHGSTSSTDASEDSGTSTTSTECQVSEGESTQGSSPIEEDVQTPLSPPTSPPMAMPTPRHRRTPSLLRRLRSPESSEAILPPSPALSARSIPNTEEEGRIQKRGDGKKEEEEEEEEDDDDDDDDEEEEDEDSMDDDILECPPRTSLDFLDGPVKSRVWRPTSPPLPLPSTFSTSGNGLFGYGRKKKNSISSTERSMEASSSCPTSPVTSPTSSPPPSPTLSDKELSGSSGGGGWKSWASRRKQRKHEVMEAKERAVAEEALRAAKLHRDLVQSRIRRASHRKLGDRPRPLRELLLVHLALVRSHEEIPIRPGSMDLDIAITGPEARPSRTSRPRVTSAPSLPSTSIPKSYRHCGRTSVNKGTYPLSSSSMQTHGPRRAMWRSSPSFTPRGPVITTKSREQPILSKGLEPLGKNTSVMGMESESKCPPSDSGYTSPEEEESKDLEGEDRGTGNHKRRVNMGDEEDEMPLHHLLSKASFDLSSTQETLSIATTDNQDEILSGSESRLKALQLDLATLCHF
ncbi:MAG: hypothetical protein DHS80DRAFT_28730 [Piptocephalis tieghemiana]|nr:MAG: hypothetical protein DHS80DRAFT_28730 [Piptocephalis tieghemiana]